MNIFIDLYSRTPVYEQIKEQIILGISTGALSPNEKLPSLRQLASSLNLNINTVKRAFSELEMQGVIYTIQGKGVFINPNTKESKKAYVKGVLEAFKGSTNDAFEVGVNKNELLKIIDKIYSDKE